MDASDVEAAWAEVTARWSDDGAHRAFLDRFGDLAGLAEVGRRYKGVLDAQPDEPIALRWRDEVVKRAAALALAQLPRTKPPRQVSGRLQRVLLVAIASASLAAIGWMLLRLARPVGLP
jgi:hypothetical protein